MKYLIFFTLILASCSDAPFINHELKAERIGDCTNDIESVKMNSNITGERYEFNYCMDDGFDGKNYTIERKGDSLLVKFPTKNKKKALYKLVLDVDAKPVYHYITLGDQTIAIVQATKF